MFAPSLPTCLDLKLMAIERETVETKSIKLMTRQQVRDLAGKLMEEWQNIDAVADVLGCPPGIVRRWYMDYRHGSSSGTRTSNEPGRPPKLTINQQNIIQDIVFTKTPLEMNHHQILWTNTLVRNTIVDLFKIHLSLATVNALIRRMGVIRRHLFKPVSGDQEPGIENWMQERFPFIKRLAQREHARIFYIYDDLVNGSRSFRTSKVLTLQSKGGSQSGFVLERRVLSAVCPRNSQRFMIFGGSLCAQPFIDFLNGLLHDYDRPLFLIADAHYKQVALEADHFLASETDRISLFFCPGESDIFSCKRC